MTALYWVFIWPAQTIFALGVLLAAKRLCRMELRGVAAALDSRAAPIVAGIVTTAWFWWTWGSLSALPRWTDESSYLLQAGIFALGRWTTAARPLPEFFEQFHVIITPFTASKYPPGHALALVPGVMLGLPGLVPLLLGGGTGALVFALARRLANGWVALLTWLLWAAAPGILEWRLSYFSESTTGLLWLVGWWALMEWREKARTRWFVALAAAIGYAAITRPLTAVVFALPVGAVVLHTVVRHGRWRDLGIGFAIGSTMLLAIPLWSAATTGDWTTTPLAHYTSQYIPWDAPGFGLDSTPATRTLPPDLEEIDLAYQDLHRAHVVEAMPRVLAGRLAWIGGDLWTGWWGYLLLPLTLLGVSLLPRAAWPGAITTVLLVLAYLPYAHFDDWTVYYTEAYPVLTFATALGVWRLTGWLATWMSRRSRNPRSPGSAPASHALQPAMFSLAVLLLLAPLSIQMEAQHRAVTSRVRAQQDLMRPVTDVPADRAIVFIRYSDRHNVHRSLILNGPDLDREQVWRVYDRGPENARLRQLAPDRVAYLYDEATQTLSELPDLPTELTAGAAREPDR